MKKIIFSTTALFCVIFTSCNTDEVARTAPVSNDDVVSESLAAKSGAWAMVFEDNFDASSSIDANWTRTNGRTDYNSSICHYKAWFSTLATTDGKQCLRLAAKKINDHEYRAGHVKSKFAYKPNNNEEYRLRASIKLAAKSGSVNKSFDKTYGAWPAFWTVQETAWPTKGEIDIMEGYSKSPYPAHFASNLFYGTSTGVNRLGSSCENSYDVADGWHTYEMRWKKSGSGYVTVTIYLDGVRIKTYNNSINSNLKLQNFGPHNIMLNLNVGSDNEIFDNSKINLFSNVYMYVDYVKLQKRSI